MRTLYFSFLLSAALGVANVHSAAAAPANGGALAAAKSDRLTLVRDGCGRGRHFSRWRGVCVWDGSEYPAYAPPPPPVYYAPPAYYYGPPYVYGPPYGYYYRRW